VSTSRWRPACGYQDTPVVSISGGAAWVLPPWRTSPAAPSPASRFSAGHGLHGGPDGDAFRRRLLHAATLGAATLAADVSGGLTKQGAGTLTLTGTDTYTNLTTVAAGTLSLESAPTATAGYMVRMAPFWMFRPWFANLVRQPVIIRQRHR